MTKFIPINAFDFIENCPAQKVTLFPGKYLFEAWGASGGGDNGGHGAYTAGIIKLSEITEFEIRVGGEGSAPLNNGEKRPGGCNGGGTGGAGAKNSSEFYYSGGGGGGATDVRVNTSSIKQSRILVSGGGGGACGIDPRHGTGGAAGGIQGLPSTGENKISPGANEAGYQKGKGQDGRSGSEDAGGGEGNGGGGGGWFGGFSSQDSGPGTDAGGGGGSSFISGCSGCENIQSNFLFSNIVMKTGEDFILSPTGLQKQGHKGNGYLKIFIVSTHTCQTTKFYFNPKVFFFLFIFHK